MSKRAEETRLVSEKSESRRVVVSLSQLKALLTDHGNTEAYLKSWFGK